MIEVGQTLVLTLLDADDGEFVVYHWRVIEYSDGLLKVENDGDVVIHNMRSPKRSPKFVRATIEN